MTDAALDWREPLSKAAQSDKPRVSVRTWALRTHLAVADKAEVYTDQLLSDLRSHEMLIADRDETLAMVREERDDLQGANERQASTIAELKGVIRLLQEDISTARAEAQTTTPPPCATMLQLIAFAALCIVIGFTVHMALFAGR